MDDGQETVNQAVEHGSHTKTGIETDPTAPHGGLFRDDRRDLAHAFFKRVISGREIGAKKCTLEMERADHKKDRRAGYHQNHGCRGTPFEAVARAVVFVGPAYLIVEAGGPTVSPQR